MEQRDVLVLPQTIDINVLQYAVVKKFETHDVLYIYDDVGTGKTIQAGLIISSLLQKKYQQTLNILIITSNNVVGQFYSELSEKFNLEPTIDVEAAPATGSQLIKIINNHNSNIAKQIELQNKRKGFKWDLIIVDEAHLFINGDAKRTAVLAKLKAKKVVFMTATPVRNDFNNIKIYPRLAASILNLPPDSTDAYRLEGKYNESTFSIENDSHLPQILALDIDSPVSRNFKEVMDITSAKKETHPLLEPKKRKVDIWRYRDKRSKMEDLKALLINILRDENEPESRFVIFCRYKESVKDVEQAFAGTELKSVVLTGDTDISYRKRQFNNLNKTLQENTAASAADKLPEVVIITSGIGEVGLNLPGYNYAVNYDIPVSSAIVEQRFGRIDRYTNHFDEIHNVFLLPDENISDTNALNFIACMGNYKYDVTPAIPAMNVILTDEVLRELAERRQLQQDCLQDAMKCLDTREPNFMNELTKMYRLFIDYNRRLTDIYQYFIEEEIGKYNFFNTDSNDQYLTDLIYESFCRMDSELTLEQFYSIIHRLLNETMRKNKDRDFNIPESGKVFYKTVDLELHNNNLKYRTLDYHRFADIEACSPVEIAGHIMNSQIYLKLEQECKQVRITQKNLDSFMCELNLWCEKMFESGLPLLASSLRNNKWRALVEKMLDKYNLEFEVEYVVARIFNHIPYGRLVKKFTEHVNRMLCLSRQDGELAWNCIRGLYIYDENNPSYFYVGGIKVEFFSEKELSPYRERWIPRLFYMTYTRKNNKYSVEASPWLKLLHLVCREWDLDFNPGYSSLNKLLTNNNYDPRTFSQFSLLFFIRENGEFYCSHPFNSGIKTYLKSLNYNLVESNDVTDLSSPIYRIIKSSLNIS
ncbi:DEAD/DEAH box helicase [Paenibacillus sp. MMS20-IR301]|uniref:DEAD/DEAH box helicase n=1 Tax=Paenibacillus sp. MMS20-IR301 TaxID=2895946 RepID=UPI0028F08636|nr:DEAD/DEAH box helicase [Paenibacillus sp. MMS20-IR301]WNS42053.1 DEAD/DEAH box helicase [Paenibacillus sp. MMS20-IR301]